MSARYTGDPVPGTARTVNLFASEGLDFRQSETRLEIAVPVTGPDPDVSVLTVEIDPTERGWSEYSAPVTDPVKSGK